jgi:hypothetical protein
MAMTVTDLQEAFNRAINMAKGAGLTKAQITSVLTTVSTAQGTDTTTHDRTIEAPPAALLPDLGN